MTDWKQKYDALLKVHEETVKDRNRCLRDISKWKAEARYFEDQLVSRTRHHVEANRREAQRRAAALFLDLANKD